MNTLSDLSAIKLVLFDVDGVLTDGTLYIGPEGETIKPFNVKDGLGIELLRTHNILTGVVSGKSSLSLDYRCKQLGFDFAITGCKNKLPQVIGICKKSGLELHQVAFCGDDVLDLIVMEKCGIGFAPSDAHSLVLDYADIVIPLKGGQGVARSVADMILQSKYVDLKAIYEPLLQKIKNDDVKNLEQ